MKRSLSSTSFEFYQDEYHPTTIQSSSISTEFLRVSDSNQQTLQSFDAQQVHSDNTQHVHSVSGNCCASQSENPTWQVKYRDNEAYDYNNDRALNFSSWDHYSPDLGMYETQEISLSEISPAPASQGYRYGNVKYSTNHTSLYQVFEDQVQNAYVNMYDSELQIKSTPIPSPEKVVEEEEYKDEDYDDDDEKPKLSTNPRPKHVGKACTHCKKAHLACDTQRPCRRCARLGKDDCVDVEHKRRGRPRGSPMHQKSERVKEVSIPAFDYELLGFVPAAAE